MVEGTEGAVAVPGATEVGKGADMIVVKVSGAAEVEPLVSLTGGNSGVVGAPSGVVTGRV